MKNKNAIITGAAGGIGSAISTILLSKGYTCVLIDIDEKNLRKFELANKKKYKTKIFSEICDISNSSILMATLKKITAQFGSFDLVINNAGIGGPFHRIDEVSVDEWDWIISTNVKSAFIITQHVLPAMKKQQFGRIVNISSIQGLFGAEKSSTYVTSKHALIGLTRSVAAEWGMFGITCNAVCPGYIQTKMGTQDHVISDHSKNVLKKTPANILGTKEQVAELVEFLTRDNSSYINGSVYTIDGGMSCHLGI